MKPQTWLIDIDGVVFEHKGRGPGEQWLAPSHDIQAIQVTLEFLEWLEMRGHHIVLVTARPEHLRFDLVLLLKEKRVIYHQLLMGVTSGTRYLVNDLKPGGVASCVAINARRNTCEELTAFMKKYEQNPPVENPITIANAL